MRGNASRRRTSSVMPNAISVQTITPRPGWTRKLPPPEAVTVMSCKLAIRLGEEEGDQAEDERVEHDRLGEREAQPLDRGDLVAHLGLAGGRLDHLAEDVADADARADRAEAGANAERDRLDRLGGVLTAARLGEDCVDDRHGVLLSGPRRTS